MPPHLFEPRSSPTPSGVEEGPVLDCPLLGSATDRSLRIRARRQYLASPDEVFAAWTSRLAWDNWIRLRARSRSSVTARRGGCFRLELAEGPTIHTVTGTFLELRPTDYLKLGWQHLGDDHVSTIDVNLRTRFDRTELTLIHSQIGSRREAAWLMRLWSLALRRLDAYLSQPAATDESRSGPRVEARVRLSPVASEPPVQRAS